MDNDKCYADIVMKNYHQARDIVAKEVSEKYGLVETFRNEEELHFESKEYIFNYLCMIPEADELYVKRKNNAELFGESFKSLMFDHFGKLEDVTKGYQEVFESMKDVNHTEPYSVERLARKFWLKTKFLFNIHPEYFL
jgi:hypothetical protein